MDTTILITAAALVLAAAAAVLLVRRRPRPVAPEPPIDGTVRTYLGPTPLARPTQPRSENAAVDPSVARPDATLDRPIDARPDTTITTPPSADRPLPPTKEVRVRRPADVPIRKGGSVSRVTFTLNAPYDRSAAWMSGGPFDLGERSYEIGREPQSDLVLSDPSVSGRHARLAPHPEGYKLTDLGSTNGTTVNGRLVTGSEILRGGETIGIGDVVLRFERKDR